MSDLNLKLKIAVDATNTPREIKKIIRGVGDVKTETSKLSTESKKTADNLDKMGKTGVAAAHDLKNGVKKAEKEVDDLSNKSKKAAKNVKKIGAAGIAAAHDLKSNMGKIKQVAAALAAAFAVRKLIDYTRQVASQAKELNNLSKTLQINRQELQVWQIAAESAGISAETMGDIFKDSQEKLGDFLATGGGEAKDIFERLKLNAEELQQLRPEEALKAIVVQMEAMGNVSQQEKIFLMESIANDASRLLPLLSDNAAELERIRALAAESNVIISDEENEKLLKANALLNELNLSWEGLTKEIGVAGSELLVAFGGGLIDIIRATSEAISAVTDAVSGFSDETFILIDSLTSGIPLIGGLVDGIELLRVTLTDAGNEALNAADSNDIMSEATSYAEQQVNLLTDADYRGVDAAAAKVKANLDKAKSYYDVADAAYEAARAQADADNLSRSIQNSAAGLGALGFARNTAAELDAVEKGLKMSLASDAVEKQTAALKKLEAAQDRLNKKRSGVGKGQGGGGGGSGGRKHSGGGRRRVPKGVAASHQRAGRAASKHAKALKKVERASVGVMQRLNDTNAKLTLSEREYFKKTLVTKKLSDDEIKLAMSLWDSNDALESNAEKAKKAAEAQKQLADELKSAAEQIFKDTRNPEEQFNIDKQKLDDLFKNDKYAEMAGGAEAYRRKLEQITQAYEQGILAQDRFKGSGVAAMADLKSAQESWASDFTDVLATAVTTGKVDFKSLADSIIQDLVRIAIRKYITSQLFSGMFGGGFAKGAAFSNGSVTPFAKGGVVSSPTLFPMSGNRTGLMGEAGDEAIMPLKRMGDGSLGVRALGLTAPTQANILINSAPQPANVQLNVVINETNNDKSSASSNSRKGGGGQDIIDLIVNLAAKKQNSEIINGGDARRAIQSTFNLSVAGR